MKIALLGLGTVGSGVLKVIENSRAKIEEAAKEPIELTHIFGRKFHNYHQAELKNITLTDDIQEIWDSGVELIVEVLGGVEYPLEIQRTALEKGIHVVTANKDLLALHIDELVKIGNETHAQLAYEATSAGGVPIIQAIEHGFNANNITQVLGILNGTTNYILTQMADNQLSFQEALDEATEKGYAESDPTDDIEGYDVRRKITLLSRLAYRKKVDVNQVSVKGIRNIEMKDLLVGEKAGLKLKLIGESSLEEDQVSIGVQPLFLSETHPLAHVGLEKNGVFVYGDAVGESMLYGPGAGSFETASAVVSDIIQTIRFGYIGNIEAKEEAKLTSEQAERSYYIRTSDNEDNVFSQAEKLGVSIEMLDNEKETVVKTSLINKEKADRLQTALSVNAIYPIY